MSNNMFSVSSNGLNDSGNDFSQDSYDSWKLQSPPDEIDDDDDYRVMIACESELSCMKVFDMYNKDASIDARERSHLLECSSCEYWERKKSHWAKRVVTIVDDGIGHCTCSECGWRIDIKDAYCRACGARFTGKTYRILNEPMDVSF